MRADRVPGPSRWLCPQCAFDLYPRMSDLDVAAHNVHHARAHHIAARLRNVPITRSELEAYVRDLDRYVRELELQASRYRGDIADLTDKVAALEAPDADELAVLRDCVAAAVADLLVKIDAHGGMGKVPPQARERWDALVAIAPKVGLDL